MGVDGRVEGVSTEISIARGDLGCSCCILRSVIAYLPSLIRLEALYLLMFCGDGPDSSYDVYALHLLCGP